MKVLAIDNKKAVSHKKAAIQQHQPMFKAALAHKNLANCDTFHKGCKK